MKLIDVILSKYSHKEYIKMLKKIVKTSCDIERHEVKCKGKTK